MKKILLLLIVLSLGCLYAFNTAGALPFANSYMQRATGVEAIYWNPANLSELPTRVEFMILPITFKVNNNALSLDLYNSVMVDTLTQELKDKLLNEMDGNLNLNFEFNTILFGYATKHFGLSTGVTAIGYSKIDENYMDLVLNGNTFDEAYHFTKTNNDMNFLVVNDITLAFGGYELNRSIPYLQKFPIPIIRYGMAFSILTGGSGFVDKFNGVFTTSDEGMNMNQDVVVNYGGGYGFKGMLGFASDVYKTQNQLVSVGMTFDNIFGTFNNNMNCEAQEFGITADDVYMVNLDEDFFTQRDTSYSIDSFSTKIPFKFSMGSLYRYRDLSVSLDIAKYSEESAFGSDKMDTSFGLEYNLMGHFPLKLGYTMANDSHPSVNAFGFGTNWKYFETGLSFQVYDSFGQSSKGASLGMHAKFRF